jgi:hypothetical protein
MARSLLLGLFVAMTAARQLSEVVRPAQGGSIAANATALAARRRVPGILYIVVTSRKTWAARGTAIERTWGSAVRSPSALVFASDYAINTKKSTVWVSPHLETVSVRAGARFIDALLQVHVPRRNWVFLADDDVFVNHRMVLQLASQLDPAWPTIHGQVRCGLPPPLRNFCGGAGALLSPKMLSVLRDHAVEVARTRTDGGSYEGPLCKLVHEMQLGTLFHHAEFHSQPPMWYRAGGHEEERPPVEPITYHYVDEWHQMTWGRRQYKCGDHCHALYDELYEEFYQRKRPLATPSAGVSPTAQGPLSYAQYLRTMRSGGTAAQAARLSRTAPPPSAAGKPTRPRGARAANATARAGRAPSAGQPKRAWPRGAHGRAAAPSSTSFLSRLVHWLGFRPVW